MKNFYSLALLLLVSILIGPEILANGGVPDVPKHRRGGGGSGGVGCDIFQENGDYFAGISINNFSPIDYQGCDMHLGYSIQGGGMEYIPMADIFSGIYSPQGNGKFGVNSGKTAVNIPVPSDVVSDACDEFTTSNANQTEITITFGYYCLVNGEYILLEDSDFTDIDFGLCCSELSFTPDQYDLASRSLRVNQTLNKALVFDINGNRIANAYLSNLEQDIQTLNIPSGIYIIRSMIDGEVVTKKVFKF